MAACSARLAVLSGAQGACARLRRAPAAPPVGALVVGVRHAAALLQRRAPALRRRSAPAVVASGAAAQPGPPVGGMSAEEKAHLATVAAKVASCAQRLKRASWLGFWSQLTLTVVSAVIIVFSIVFKGVTKGTDAGLYFILFGIVAAFLSVFWTMGYRRLGDRLRRGVDQPELAPPRSQARGAQCALTGLLVIHSLTSGVTINMLGMGFTVVGLQATTGLLFAKTLSVAAQNPYLSGAAFNPVLALDIFLVQAAANALLAHFIGAALSLWLLKSVTD